MSKAVWFVFALLFLASSSMAFAGSDGATLINQTAVLKAGGFPYVITQPGSYKLNGNLVVPADTTGIEIKANGVTLDLDGFNITGAITCAGGDTSNCSPEPSNLQAAGIFSWGNTNTIRGGHVRGFAFGVKTFGGLVEDVRVTENWFVGIEANDAVLRKNSAKLNHLIGIQAFNSLVTESAITDNGSRQVVVGGGGAFSHNIVRWFLNNGVEISISVVSDHTSSCIFSGTFQTC